MGRGAKDVLVVGRGGNKLTQVVGRGVSWEPAGGRPTKH